MNERNRLARAWVVALSVTGIAHAQTTPAPAGPPRTAPVAEGAAAPAPVPGPRELAHADTAGLTPISRSEALTRAMRNNPTLRIAELDVKSAKASVQGEEG